MRFKELLKIINYKVVIVLNGKIECFDSVADIPVHLRNYEIKFIDISETGLKVTLGNINKILIEDYEYIL